MSISNEQKNLIDNLRVPIKSFRIFALEEAIRFSDSPEVLAVLEEIKILEDDPECSMLISHAIQAVQDRIAGAKKIAASIGDSTEFLNKWKEADDNQRMQTISNLPARLPKDLRALGPQLLEGCSPIVAARVIRSFSRNWPEEKYNLITEKLHSESLVLKLAALRTLVHLKPDVLLPDLPMLLVSNDPEIKALAIRGLVKIDKEEALKHLQALLLSPTTTERLAGIQNCPFLPFDMVKPLLLKYFAAETNPELLTKAGWIIEMNPDAEVPFSLFEIAERSPAKKATLVKNVLNEAVKLLNQSGILGNQFTAYTRKLQEWVNKRSALRNVRQIVARLDTPTVAPEIEKNILVAMRQQIYKETFSEAYKTWPISDLAKSHLAKYLGISSDNTKKDVQSTNNAQNNKIEQTIKTQKKVETLSQPQTQTQIQPQPQNVNSVEASHSTQNLSQFEMLATITPEKAAEKLDQITLMISHKNSPTDLKIAALQCLTRCRINGLESIATRLINHHEIQLATAAVEYLGIVNPDSIFPYLGQCLKISDVGMKSAALGILKNYDYNQAVSYLRAMLYSSDKTQQNMAMECINQFDFALVRDMLTEFLCMDYPENLLEAGLLHFAANPSAENVYSLYKIEQAHIGKISEQAKALREACPEPTEDVSTTLTAPVESDTIKEEEKTNKEEVKKAKEAELKERLRAEKEKKASKKPAYAYRSAADEPERNSKEQLIAIWEAIVAFCKSKALPITTVILIIVLIGFYVLFVPKGGSSASSGGSALVAQEGTVEGQVTKVSDGIVTFTGTNDNIYILKPNQDGFKVPEIGSKLRVSLLPYRKSKDGKISVKIRKMRRIPNYSKQFSGNKAK